MDQLDSISYRAKAKGDAVALGLRGSHSSHVHAGRFPMFALKVLTFKDSNQDLLKRYLTFRLHPEGYDLNFKYPDSPLGEISVSYNVLDVEPNRGVRSNGTLDCVAAMTHNGTPAFAADITQWIPFGEPQQTLFGETDRLLLPNRKGVVDEDPVVWCGSFHV